mmetsp:Transcript_39806/g.89827  ORF Transcript_39806/g.89827 Transcript_39806/m.89827 type:complete len:278 (-) Transcript_39806:133-966(-)
MWVVGYVQDNPRPAALYALFFIGVLVIYKTLEARATGQFDYLLTLSAALQSLAFALLVFDTQSAVGEGLSEKSLWAFFIAHVTRLSTTFWGQGYIPEDNTSDVYLYQLLELTGVLLVAYQLLKLNTVRTMQDVGQGFERWSMLIGMVVVSLVLAMKTKSTGHADYFADMSWMFSVWLEALALGPQVHLLFGKNQVDESAIHFAGLTLGAAFCFGFFWGRHAREAGFGPTESAFFWGIGTASTIRVLLCACYFFLFVRSTRSGKPKGGEYELCGHEEL